MKKEELKKTHPLYDRFIEDWRLYIAAYEGIKALIEVGVIEKHERESPENFKARQSKAYGFGYSKSIADIITLYLFRKPAARDLGQLSTDDAWERFSDDCDLYGTDLDTALLDYQRYASIYGHIGILVDKPPVQTQTRADEKAAGLYPYMAAYHPQSILDWRFDRGQNGRPFLSYLKLVDEDGLFRIWTPEQWEIWELPRDDKGGEGDPVLVGEGINPLGEIPFVWLYNVKTRRRGVGGSDISECARLDASIIRNLSQAEEVVDYTAFPMMLVPSIPAGDEPEQTVGPSALLEFNPNNPEARPSWLEAKCLEPITAILNLIDRKVQEIYRSSNIGGLATVEVSKQAKSGVALKQEFQLLNAKLVSKANNLEEAERSLVYFWLRWQGQDGWYDDVSIERPKDFDIEDLVTDLANALTAQSIIKSNLFQIALQKYLARQMLPTLKDAEFDAIDKELDEQTQEKEKPSVRKEADEALGDENEKDNEEDSQDKTP